MNIANLNWDNISKGVGAIVDVGMTITQAAKTIKAKPVGSSTTSPIVSSGTKPSSENGLLVGVLALAALLILKK
jgi:hypothetical protein